MDVYQFWYAILLLIWLDLGSHSGGPTLHLYGKNQYETHVGIFGPLRKKTEKCQKKASQKDTKTTKNP